MKFLGVIPARGGSKGIKKKNIAICAGRPLIEYTIHAAKNSFLKNDFIVSTDCEIIKSVAEACGSKVFKRSGKTATDSAKTVDAVKELIDSIDGSHTRYTHIILLQPTSPLRTEKHIDESVNLYTSQRCYKTLISGYDATSVHPEIMYKKHSTDQNLVVPYINKKSEPKRRQEFESVFIRNGAIYITEIKFLYQKNSLYDSENLFYEMSQESSYNIDEPFDLKIVEQIINETR